jgi:hypothetical protein
MLSKEKQLKWGYTGGCSLICCTAALKVGAISSIIVAF